MIEFRELSNYIQGYGVFYLVIRHKYNDKMRKEVGENSAYCVTINSM